MVETDYQIYVGIDWGSEAHGFNEQANLRR